jgi:cytochrome bd-type quinol oxidase subunit 2
MADPGSPVSYQVLVPKSRQVAYSQLMAAAASASGNFFDGTQVTSDGGSSLQLERKFLPTWVIVVTIITVITCCGLGLLFLLMRTTEVCQITLQESQGGTVITVNGQLSSAVSNSIGAAVAALQA